MRLSRSIAARLAPLIAGHSPHVDGDHVTAARAALGMAVLLLLTGVSVTSAHEMRPGLLELHEISPGTYSFLWKKPSGGEVEIQIAPVLPKEWRLRTPDRQPLTPGAVVVRGTLECPAGLEGQTVSIAGLEATATDVLVRIYHADGRLESHLLSPAKPSITLGQSGGGRQHALGYLQLGVQHIGLGVDHLLFVLGLLLIVSDRWKLLKTISAFTVAHSLTLAVATLGLASIPMSPLNALIALSIFFLGPEIVHAWRGETSFTIRHPWVVAFGFGLLHGFGFASGLTSLGLAPGEIVSALLWFNVGVELGQLAFVICCIALIRSFKTLQVRWPRWAEILPGYAVGTLGAYWTIQRIAILLGGPQ